MFSSCVEAVDLRLSDSDVALVFLKRASSNAPAYSRALQPVCPNMGNAFKRFSVDKEEIMFAAGSAGSLKQRPELQTSSCSGTPAQVASTVGRERVTTKRKVAQQNSGVLSHEDCWRLTVTLGKGEMGYWLRWLAVAARDWLQRLGMYGERQSSLRLDFSQIRQNVE